MAAVVSTEATLPIDVANSRASFSVQHIFVERVTGSVPILSGVLVFQKNSERPTRVSATLDATKLATGDVDRDAALQSPDWFDTKRFAVWTFESTKITPTTDNAFLCDGLLTIHGATVPEELTVTISRDALGMRFRASGKIDRHAFDMAVSRLDAAIGNPVDITLDVRVKAPPGFF